MRQKMYVEDNCDLLSANALGRMTMRDPWNGGRHRAVQLAVCHCVTIGVALVLVFRKGCKELISFRIRYPGQSDQTNQRPTILFCYRQYTPTLMHSDTSLWTLISYAWFCSIMPLLVLMRYLISLTIQACQRVSLNYGEAICENNNRLQSMTAHCTF